MAKNDSKSTDNPKLLKKLLSDGNYSLYLDYYLGRVKVVDEVTGEIKSKIKRKRVYLRLTLYGSPRTVEERNQNNENFRVAKEIRATKEKEFLEDTQGFKFRLFNNINFLDYYQTYLDNYTKKDKRNIKLSLSRFKDFLRDTPDYSIYKDCIKPSEITPDIITAFTEYLQSRSTGEGAKTLYQRFKKVIWYAIRHDVILKNPCDGITIKSDINVLRKDILSLDEIQTLIQTHYNKESKNIRKAFIFCLYTGLRWCDVKDLTFRNVDYSNKFLKFEQNKTKGHSDKSGVVTPLNDGLLALIGEPGDSLDELIFNLPSYEACLAALKRWVKRAGINKHISWHCARHSFAVNILNNGANIKTVADLLGHSGLKYTEKYTRAVDELKKKAIDSLPELKL
jgi:integrase/recombinase XerD